MRVTDESTDWSDWGRDSNMNPGVPNKDSTCANSNVLVWLRCTKNFRVIQTGRLKVKANKYTNRQNCNVDHNVKATGSV